MSYPVVYYCQTPGKPKYILYTRQLAVHRHRHTRRDFGNMGGEFQLRKTARRRSSLTEYRSDFCMYSDRSAEPGRYVIIIEPDEEVPQSRLEELAGIMEQELIRANDDYAYLAHLAEDGGSTSNREAETGIPSAGNIPVLP